RGVAGPGAGATGRADGRASGARGSRRSRRAGDHADHGARRRQVAARTRPRADLASLRRRPLRRPDGGAAGGAQECGGGGPAPGDDPAARRDDRRRAGEERMTHLTAIAGEGQPAAEVALPEPNRLAERARAALPGVFAFLLVAPLAISNGGWDPPSWGW